MTRVLYLTYDGLTDPLGQSQVCPYIRELANLGHQITVLSFEKDQATPHSQAHYAPGLGSGTRWIRLRYHKRFRTIATLFDITHATMRVVPLLGQVDVVHVRSYVLAPIALMFRALSRAQFLFDIRGLWVQERIDGGLVRKNSILATLLERLERLLYRNADWVITLTKRSVAEIRRLSSPNADVPITVIPTSVDLQRFSPAPFPKIVDQRTFCYLGSFGTWYNTDKLFEFAECVLKNGDSFRLAVNTIDDKQVENFVAAGAEVTKLDHALVPQFLAECSASVFFIHPMASKIASCPTKLAESLAMGLPVITASGIGDVDEIIMTERVGIVLHDDDFGDCHRILSRVDALFSDPRLYERCREVARKRFSLDRAVRDYNLIYDSLENR